MSAHATFRIVLQKPPSGVDFGVQKGRGRLYETIERKRSNGGDLQFEFTIDLPDGDRRSAPDLRGPIVQGPRGERFVYIDIGTSAGQQDTPWSRRLKVPLSGITWDMLVKASADARAVIATRVPGTGRDGGPTCATVRPFDGWKLAR